MGEAAQIRARRRQMDVLAGDGPQVRPWGFGDRDGFIDSGQQQPAQAAEQHSGRCAAEGVRRGVMEGDHAGRGAAGEGLEGKQRAPERVIVDHVEGPGPHGRPQAIELSSQSQTGLELRS